MKGNYVIRDRYGYWVNIEANSPDDAVRRGSNLSKDASLEYASCSYVGQVSQEEVDVHNCETAYDIAGMRCQCGKHSY